MTVYYFTQTDLENALGKNIVLAVYDDDHDGVVDTAAMTSCRAYGTSECNSFVRGLHPDVIPMAEVDVPDEMRFAALDFGIAYTMRRRPDLVRAMGEESWTAFRDSAISTMKRYVQAVQRMPPAMGTPTNVGAVVAKTADPANESTTIQGSRFEDFGDF
jgi:hypothetical protein